MKPVKNIRLVIAAAKKSGRILEPLKVDGVVYGYVETVKINEREMK